MKQHCVAYRDVSMYLTMMHARTHACMHARMHTCTFYDSQDFVRDYPGEYWAGFYWSKRQSVAVASAGPYANLHLAPGNHASTPPLSFYRPDALPATQPTVSKHWRNSQWHKTEELIMKC